MPARAAQNGVSIAGALRATSCISCGFLAGKEIKQGDGRGTEIRLDVRGRQGCPMCESATMTWPMNQCLKLPEQGHNNRIREEDMCFARQPVMS